MGRRFLDTNLLVYADDASAGRKQRIAQEVLAECLRKGDGVISTQVLQEYFVVATRKLRVPAELAQRKVTLFARLELVEVRLETILGAIDIHRLHGLSFWDALILETASAAACGVVLTEDLQPGATVRGVRVENPFAGS